MSSKQPHRAGRTAQAMLLAGVAISTGLVGCSQTVDLAAHATKLSAAQDSDVLAPPSERVYEVTDIDVTSPPVAAGLTLPETITPTGYFVVGDGVITDAWFETSFGNRLGDQASASFKLTEPTVLRRIQSEDGSLTAVGTLTYGGVDRPDTTVQFSVVSLDDEGAEVDVLVNAPATVLSAGEDEAAIAARITFDVQ